MDSPFVITSFQQGCLVWSYDIAFMTHMLNKKPQTDALLAVCNHTTQAAILTELFKKEYLLYKGIGLS